jgi:hypothetical protein
MIDEPIPVISKARFDEVIRQRDELARQVRQLKLQLEDYRQAHGRMISRAQSLFEAVENLEESMRDKLPKDWEEQLRRNADRWKE